MEIKVGILGATGMVGQQFVKLLANHPWFKVVCVAASPQSAGKSYEEAVFGRWKLESDIPDNIKKLIVRTVEEDVVNIVRDVDLVFCALDMEKDKIKRIEEEYASRGVAVISNNSAHRWTIDVPMIIPEVNPQHVELINIQRQNRGWKSGLIAVKPNCSIQSYVIILTTLKKFNPQKVQVISLQAISGAGKTFADWPEMIDNVIPFIGGEEDKSEKEPLKIWGDSLKPVISATCIRVPVTNGHMANVSVSFETKPTREQILKNITEFNPLSGLDLPSSPKTLIQYIEEENRPQTKLDRDYENGMGITMGRLQEDIHFDWKFVALSHNTIRGAAGGAILMAELLVKKGYVQKHTR